MKIRKLELKNIGVFEDQTICEKNGTKSHKFLFYRIVFVFTLIFFFYTVKGSVIDSTKCLILKRTEFQNDTKINEQSWTYNSRGKIAKVVGIKFPRDVKTIKFNKDQDKNYSKITPPDTVISHINLSISRTTFKYNRDGFKTEDNSKENDDLNFYTCKRNSDNLIVEETSLFRHNDYIKPRETTYYEYKGKKRSKISTFVYEKDLFGNKKVISQEVSQNYYTDTLLSMRTYDRIPKTPRANYIQEDDSYLEYSDENLCNKTYSDTRYLFHKPKDVYFTYDKNNRLIKEATSDKETIEYTYDDNGNLNKIIQNSPNYSCECNYTRKNGKNIEISSVKNFVGYNRQLRQPKKYVREKLTTFEYDSNGRLISNAELTKLAIDSSTKTSEKLVIECSFIKKYFDKNGYSVEEISNNEWLNLSKKENNFNLFFYDMKYKYDSSYNLKELTKLDENRGIEEISKYEYDSHRNLIKSTTFDRNGKELSHIITEYKCD